MDPPFCGFWNSVTQFEFFQQWLQISHDWFLMSVQPYTDLLSLFQEQHHKLDVSAQQLQREELLSKLDYDLYENAYLGYYTLY